VATFHSYVPLSRQVWRTDQALPGGLCLAGKLGRRGVVAAVRPGGPFFVSDSLTQRRYLVDTGSSFSIMPWQSSDPPSGPRLTGADGRRIPCWGERAFSVAIGGVSRRWQFLLAAVSFPILGVDFLRHHSLVVDVANLRLSAPLPVVGMVTPGRSYADAVRSSPVAAAPAPVGGTFFPGGSSTPSPSPAVAASPPGRVAGQGGALPSPGGISTPPPLSAAASSPHTVTGGWLARLAAPVSSGVFSGCRCLFIGPRSRRAAHYPDNWPTSDRQISAAGSGALRCRQTRVPVHARRGNHPPFFQPMEQSSPHGPEEGRLLVALRRLPPA
jgi:hypothetical protein